MKSVYGGLIFKNKYKKNRGTDYPGRTEFLPAREDPLMKFRQAGCLLKGTKGLQILPSQ